MSLMGLPLKPKHVARYRDLARLLVKYGRRDLVEGAGLVAALPKEEHIRNVGIEDVDPDAARLADDLEKLGPTYIKLGQLLSTRADRIVVPAPIIDYTTSRVLTMEYVRGEKVTSLPPVRRIEFDGDALCSQLFDAYLKQFLVDGIFHADPHPGNVFLTDDDRIALIDLGMIGYVSQNMQDRP